MRHVDQTSGKVTGVRGLKGGVGQAFSCAVRGNEVFQHRQTLLEVGSDRRLDDLAAGVRHKPSHAGQLLDLVAGAAGAGVDHHVQRVQFAEFLSLALKFGVEVFGNSVGSGRPNVDNAVVALFFRNGAGQMLFGDLVDFLLGVVQNVVAAGRDHHVGSGDGNASPGGLVEAGFLDTVESFDRANGADRLEAVHDQFGKTLLVDGLVVIFQFVGQKLVEENAPGRSVDDLFLFAFQSGFGLILPVGGEKDLDVMMQTYDAVVVSPVDFLRSHDARVGDEMLFEPGVVGQIIDAQDDILGRHHHRLAGSR